MFNTTRSENGLVKQGMLDLCYVSSGKQLRGQPIFFSVHRTPGEFFAVLQFLNPDDRNGAPTSTCINLRHCRAETCANPTFIKLMLNDFTSGLLLRVPNANEHDVHELGDVSVIDKKAENLSTSDERDWLNAFCDLPNTLGVKHVNAGFRRSQSLQTVLESDEEDV